MSDKIEVRKIYRLNSSNQTITDYYDTLDQAKDAAEEWSRSSQYNIAYVRYGNKVIQYELKLQLVVLEEDL